MACRFCEKTRQLAQRAWQRAVPHRPHVGTVRPHGAPAPIEQMEIVIDRAGDGERVWINAPHCIARWYRIKKVVVSDRRSQAHHH